MGDALNAGTPVNKSLPNLLNTMPFKNEGSNYKHDATSLLPLVGFSIVASAKSSLRLYIRGEVDSDEEQPQVHSSIGADATSLI